MAPPKGERRFDLEGREVHRALTLRGGSSDDTAQGPLFFVTGASLPPGLASRDVEEIPG